MLTASPAAKAWHDAMAAQDDHEIFECPPCRASELPRCELGRRLQQAARTAHERWLADQYVPLAVSR